MQVFQSVMLWIGTRSMNDCSSGHELDTGNVCDKTAQK